jgi:3'(2'), 5'-bisphosphate nucleotidase
MSPSEELNLALRAAWKAAARILEDYERLVPIPDAPASISTATDRLAQEIILQEIHATFPTDALSAEEATETLRHAPRNGERLWIVDPIDGTRGFARKNGEFSVMVALVVRGQIQLGVVLAPVTRTILFAERGRGVGEAVLTVSRSEASKTAPLVRRLRPRSWIETYSAGLKLALVARGVADAYINTYPEFHDWDVCAGQILVEEAGGTVTTLSGRPVQYGANGDQREGLIASNGMIHQKLLEAARGIRRSTD